MDDRLIFCRWAEGNVPTEEDYSNLKQLALADRDRRMVFNVTEPTLAAQLSLQAHILPKVAPQLLHHIPSANPVSLYQTLWNIWLPLSIQLTQYQKELNRPLIQGILGGQGTGKTTLAAALKLILTELGYRSASLSLDDLYKTYRDRQSLKQHDPRLIRRGPPGTHDINLGIDTLQQCRHSQYPVNFPRFDKSAYGGEGERTTPEIITDADIIFFEGWFVGVQPIDPHQFNEAPLPIETEEDCQFAQEINQRLADYLPLWECLDRLMVLYPTDYRFSKQWRKQAEREMRARGKSGMSDAEIDEFVEYFWRSLHPELFITPLIQNPEVTDLAIAINSDRSINRVYRPANSD